MITQFFALRALSLFTAFVAGVLLTALLLPASEPDYLSQPYVARIKSLEAQISGRDKTFKEISRGERKLSLLRKSAEQNSAALESNASAIAQKTGLARKTLAAFKKRVKENEPIFPKNPDDRDLVIRLDKLLAGIGVGKGEAG